MSSEKNLQQLESLDLLELPPAYDKVETLSQVSFNENNKKEPNGENNSSKSTNNERNTNQSSFKPTNRGFHPASFLFGIPIIGMLACKAMQLELRMSENPYHHGHQRYHESHWGHKRSRHRRKNYRHQRKMERRERRLNCKMERDIARVHRRC